MLKKQIVAIFMAFLFLFPQDITVFAYQNDNYGNDLKIGIRNMSASVISVTLNGNYTADGKSYSSGKKFDLKLSGGKLLFDSTQYYDITFIPEKPDNTLTLSISGTSVGTKKYNFRGNMNFKIAGDKIFPVNILNIEDYLKGVVGYEMSNSYPTEALKAQAVAARNYALSNIRKHRSEGYDLCDSTDCQVYRGYDPYYTNVIRSVDETRGIVLLHNEELVSAYYSASNGGYTEACENVWVQTLPYLAAKPDEFDNEEWSAPRVFTTEKIDSELKNRGYLSADDTFIKFDLENIERYASGRIAKLFIVYKKADGTITSKYVYKERARIFLPLPSSLYWITYDKTTDTYTFTGKGNGHALGLSQIGAKNRANDGQTFEEILTFYYDGSYIDRLVNTQDKLPPVVSSVSPSSGEKDVKINKTISIAFNENIQPGENFENIEIRDDSGSAVESNFEINNNILTINPDENLKYFSMYSVIIPSGAVSDLSGNLFDRDYVFSFMTEPDTSAPKLLVSSPKNYEDDIPLNDDIIVIFDENIQRGKNFGSITLTSSDGKAVAGTCTIEDNALVIRHINPFDFYAKYTVKIPAYSIEDMWSNEIKSEVKFSFTTVKSDGPMVKSSSPKAGSTNAGIDSKLTVTFDKKIYKDDLFDDISLRDSNGREINITRSISSSTLTVKPDSYLDYSTKYTLSIPEGSLKDYTGNEFVTSQGDYLLEFTTQNDTSAPTVKETNPKTGSKYVSVDGSILITFSESVVPSDYYKDIKLKNPKGTAVSIKKTYSENTLEIIPVEKLDYYTKYTLEIPSGAVEDEAKSPNGLKSRYTLSFTTADNIAPVVKSTSPSSKYTDKITDNVKVGGKITLTFSENIYEGNNLQGITLMDTDGVKKPLGASIKGTTLTITPDEYLGYNKTYIIVVPQGAVVDNVGNEFKDGYVFSFKTELDKTSPVVKSASPKNGEKNVEVSGSIAIVFSEGIQIGENFHSITLKAYNGDYVDLILDENCIFGNTLIIVPAEQLSNYKKYTLTIPAGAVKDIADTPNILKSKYVMSFTTEK